MVGTLGVSVGTELGRMVALVAGADGGGEAGGGELDVGDGSAVDELVVDACFMSARYAFSSARLRSSCLLS